MTEPTPGRGPAPRGRAVAFWVLAALMLLGPIYGHFFATGSAKYLGWKMFSRKATNFCAVDFVDGEGAPLDRYAVLKVTRDDRRGAYLRRLRDVAAAERVGQTMCKAIGRGAHVALTARCAQPDGWSPVVERGDLCRP